MNFSNSEVTRNFFLTLTVTCHLGLLPFSNSVASYDSVAKENFRGVLLFWSIGLITRNKSLKGVCHEIFYPYFF